MNIYDSNRIRELLLAANYQESENIDSSDIVIFYTCNIREKAVSKLFSDIGRISKKENKILAIGGCVAQAEQDNIFERCKDINIIFGPQTYHNLPRYINEIIYNENKKIIDVNFSQTSKFIYFPKIKTAQFSEFVSIQEGCNNFCTYCVVPYTRGREYSRPAKDIISEVKNFITNGAKEITLIGQNVNSYKSEYSFEKLLREVASIDGLKRLRYTTSHPKDFSEELMRVHQELKEIIAPFAHIPVQSGSNRILHLMNRGHTTEEYLKKLEKFKEICEDISFSSDFIVGFPGETEEDFESTVKLAKKVNFSLFYAFKYSRRKNTPAYSMENQIHITEKNRRFEILLEVLKESQLSFNSKCIGNTQVILFEKKGKKKNQYIGKSQYMQSVIVESDTDIVGQFKSVYIKEAYQNSLFGLLL